MLGIINTNIKGVKEKMRRSKFNSIVLCLFVILTMLFLFACEEDHEHTFDDSWSSDEIYHYHEASCEQIGRAHV